MSHRDRTGSARRTQRAPGAPLQQTEREGYHGAPRSDDAVLADVLAHPDEDAPRLVYADALLGRASRAAS